ncbi:DUF1835 domain-containing protein [Dyella tabacisoli]|uniref:DUF1835 domain-containing protein n=1 Tax=Dyella tabacisoli TaxID=2282381 RepID=A0A369ULU0_9GAMM|nr:DUF1835 domain-containing protein [Dyella tabacisoli]
MPYIHVVCGDSAGGSLRHALAQVGRSDQIIVLRDDLAIGPLVGIDDSCEARARFWQQVAPRGDIDFTIEMQRVLDKLAVLQRDDADVVIWHGPCASDQLLLRRVVFHLRRSPHRLHEVAMDVRELVGTPQSELASLAMYPLERLAPHFFSMEPIALPRLGRLCDEWRQSIAANADMRLWKDGELVSAAYRMVDTVIVQHTLPEWQRASRVVGDVMGSIEGVLASDGFIFWRCLALVEAGELALRGHAALMRSCELRRHPA